MTDLAKTAADRVYRIEYNSPKLIRVDRYEGHMAYGVLITGEPHQVPIIRLALPSQDDMARWAKRESD